MDAANLSIGLALDAVSCGQKGIPGWQVGLVIIPALIVIGLMFFDAWHLYAKAD